MCSFQQKYLRRLPGALLGGCLLLATAACSHTITTPDGKVTIKDKGKDSGTITVTGKDGQKATVSYNENKIPDDYPKDVPVYSAKVVMAQTFSEKHARNLVMESGDGVDKISDFYKKGFEGGGWKTESTMTTDKLTMITFSKENRQVLVQISDGGDKRSIMQVLTDKQ